MAERTEDMIKLTNEIIKNYQIRKTKKQKTEFIELLRAHFPEMRIESGGFLKCRNLVIGDVESAKVVFGAHYDTAAALPIPNLLFPKNPLLFVLCQFLIVVPMIFFMLAVGITVFQEENISYFAESICRLCDIMEEEEEEYEKGNRLGDN
ncbi:MAG: hypothetical protein HFG99_04590 [Dorea sp.]|nr:hypothetical protein [Dorea sp.]MCI9248419.1 hypothetical protein [Dorea sp.]